MEGAVIEVFWEVGWSVLAGNEGTALGDVEALFFAAAAGGIGLRPAATAPGGGGKGAIPRECLSLAAAAAAAEAYFNISPGARVGNGAGFMLLVVVPFDVDAIGVCSVASAGSGDFSCIEGLRPADMGGSDTDGAFGLAVPRLPPRPSAVSGKSSATD